MTEGFLLAHDDVGAPQIQKNTGDMKALLDAVLVDGYGAVSPLGWTKEYEAVGSPVAVYKNNGTGFYLKVDDTLSDRYTAMYSYEMMYGLNDYHYPIHSVENVYYLHRAIDGQTPPDIPWWVIGDDKFFHIVINAGIGYGASHVYYHLCHHAYFGDYIPMDDDNKWNWVHACSVADNHQYFNNGTETGFTYNTFTERSGVRIPRGKNYTPDPVSICQMPACGHHNNGFGYVDEPTFSSIFDDDIFTAAVFLLAQDGIMGKVPGLLHPLLQYGVDGEDISLANMNSKVIRQVDYGDFKELRFPIPISSSYPNRTGYKIIHFGKGFRDDLL